MTINGETRNVEYFADQDTIHVQNLNKDFIGVHFDSDKIKEVKREGKKMRKHKNLNKDKAIEFLDLIYSSIENHAKFLKESNDNNNIVFKYDDMNILIHTTSDGYNIRIFWNGFDASWEKTAFVRSKKRFEKKIKQ